nr:hypothetical protein [Tanacetum cinerariifolium]
DLRSCAWSNRSPNTKGRFGQPAISDSKNIGTGSPRFIGFHFVRNMFSSGFPSIDQCDYWFIRALNYWYRFPTRNHPSKSHMWGVEGCRSREGGNVTEVREKRMAGISGLTATVDAIQTGKKTLLLGVWKFDNISPSIDATLKNLKFINKGANDLVFGMTIPMVMLSEEIKAFEDYLNYLAKSIGTQHVKVKGRGKGFLTKKGVEVVVETVRIPKKRRSKTVIKETGQSEEVADTIDLEETKNDEEEPQLTRRRQIGVVIGRAVHTKNEASKDDFIIQQRPKGSSKGSGVVPKFPDEPKGSSSGSCFEYEDSDRFLTTDDDNSDVDAKKKTKDAKDKVVRMSKIDHSKAINKSIQAHLNKVLLTAAPDFGKLKKEKAAKQSMPKFFTKAFDDDSLKEYDMKTALLSQIMSSKSFKTYLSHQKLYKALMDSLEVDDDELDNQFDVESSLKKRRHDDQDHANADKDTKNRRKDSNATSLKISKDKEALSKEGKASSKSSKTNKVVDAEETVQDDAMNTVRYT